ncbi:hypothetical protein IWQ60_002139 [Tieghemiomyces parasiticus]|uniref:Uncharacterized protein n=1 Tax=Tieghemiomyces parasiticus TaxID=78921 RepID=A0A9W8E1B2_9FUNG|nr:hypothetical protein IWQ60_002139 [Tieghemiomyces parasiticus]
MAGNLDADSLSTDPIAVGDDTGDSDSSIALANFTPGQGAARTPAGNPAKRDFQQTNKKSAMIVAPLVADSKNQKAWVQRHRARPIISYGFSKADCSQPTYGK